jgi:uncharacterized membrane protein
MTANRKITVIYIATLIGTILWIGALFYAPYLKKNSSPLSGFLYVVFSPTCHQIPSRCFYAFGHPLAVCARCLGVYSGFLLGMVIFPLTKGFSKISMPKVKTLIILSIPILIDVTGNLLGLWASSDWVRLATGIVWAIILPFYFLAGITDYFLHKRKPTKLT